MFFSRGRQGMRIVVIGPVPPYRGGIAHFSAALAEELKNSGNDVLVISYRTQYPKILYPGKSDKDLTQQPYPAQFIFSAWNYFDWVCTIKKILSFKPDRVIYPWWVSFWSPATSWLLRKLKRAGVPVKVLVHNSVPHEATWLDKKLSSHALRKAVDFVTMNEKESQRLRQIVDDNVKITYAPHPVYRSFTKSGLTSAQIKDQLNLPANVLVALFFGFVRPYKGLNILLEAMAILKAKGIKLHLLVAGEFWDDQQTYLDTIERLGLSETVSIRGEYIPENQAGLCFESADIFVAPYLDGTQSGSIKLAMSYGLPLVVTEAITDPLIQNNPAGCEVVPAADPIAFAAGIERALQMSMDRISTEEYLHDTWKTLVDILVDQPIA